MTETSRKVFEFLKKHHSKEFTKHELVEAVDTTMSAVNGSVNWLLKKGYAVERIEVTKAKYKGQKDMEMRFVQITESGIEYDPDEEEYVIEGPRVERMLGYTNLESEKGFAFFQNFLKETGILEQLEELGIQEGDTVRIYGHVFDYYK